MYIGSLLIKELKRIVETSEITKSVLSTSPRPFPLVSSFHPDPSVPCTYREDDAKWPKKDVVGKQELEIRVGNDHISFEVRLLPFSPSLLTSLPCSARLLRSLLGRLARQTSKIGSLVDVQDSEDPEGLRVFYYLVQDLKVSSPSTLLLPSLPFPSR